ncbi:MAG TPA: hypothetical protein VFF30_12715, partial [Nitrososphaerales archaeon]|nr:hypothetical protein [Nitrososphaerales archaeon]
CAEVSVCVGFDFSELDYYLDNCRVFNGVPPRGGYVTVLIWYLKRETEANLNPAFLGLGQQVSNFRIFEDDLRIPPTA